MYIFWRRNKFLLKFFLALTSLWVLRCAIKHTFQRVS